MSDILIHRNSTISGATPTTEQIEIGEIQINVKDGRVFYGKSGNTKTVEQLISTNTINQGDVTINGEITANTFVGSLSGTSSNSDKLDGMDSTDFATVSGNTFNGNQIINGNVTVSKTITITPLQEPINENVDGNLIYVKNDTGDLIFTKVKDGIIDTVNLKWLEGNLYTGLLSGGLISATVSGTTFNISAGTGLIVTLNTDLSGEFDTSVKYIKWNDFNNVTLNFINTHIQTFIAIDSNSQVIQSDAPFYDGQYNTLITLGTVIHQNKTFVNSSITYPNTAYGFKQRTYDFIKAFGPLKLGGLSIIPTNDLELNITPGTAWADGRNYANNPNNPSYIVDNGTDVSKIFRYHFVSGTTFVQDTNNGIGYTTIDPTKYNLNGVLTTVPGTGSNRKWTIQRIFWYPNSATKGIVVYYGNKYYNSSTDAAANNQYEDFYEIENTKQNAIYLGALVLRNDAIFTDNSSYLLLPSGIFRNVGGSSGGGGNIISTRLDELNDVAISTLNNGDLLYYDNIIEKWVHGKTLTGDYQINGDLNVSGNIQGIIQYSGLTNIPTSIVTGSTQIYLTGTTGFSTYINQPLLTTSNVTFNGITNNGILYNNNTLSRDKIRLFNDANYTIGLQNNVTFGSIENDYAMTFQMPNFSNSGFWWGDSSHTTAQGAMALSTDGKLTVARSLRLGYGESDTTLPGSSYVLDISGSTFISNSLNIGSPTTGIGVLSISNGTYTHRILSENNSGLTIDTGFSNAFPIKLEGSKVIMGITGNVGIGTLLPSTLLDVYFGNDSVKFSYLFDQYLNFSGNSNSNLFTSNGQKPFIIKNNIIDSLGQLLLNTNYISIENGSLETIRFTYDNKVLIGNSSDIGNGSKLQVSGLTTFNGNLLINTTVDSGYKLDVNGTINASYYRTTTSFEATNTTPLIFSFNGNQDIWSKGSSGIIRFIDNGYANVNFSVNQSGDTYVRGKLGVGITPIYNFQVSKSVNSDIVAQIANTSTSGYGLRVRNGIDTNYAFSIENSIATQSNIQLFGNGNSYFAGNMGIGTQFISEKLTINGNLFLPSLAFGGGGSALIGVVNDTFTIDGITMPHYGLKWETATGSIGNVLHQSAYFGVRFYSGGSLRLSINQNGYIGFGVTTANAPLQFSNVEQNRKIVLYEEFNNDHRFYGFGINSGTLRYQVPFGAKHIFFGSTSTGSSIELMRIQANGNIGIGITSDNGYKLDVNGLSRIYATTTTSQPILTIETIGLNSRPYINFRAEGSSLGYVGWGGTGSAIIYIMNYLNSDIQLGTNSSTQLTIKGSGNVMIGATSDSGYKLDVQGSLRTTSDAYLQGFIKTTKGIIGSDNRILIPNGASYNSSSSIITGAFKIKLPTIKFNSNTMIRMTIKIYTYNAGKSYTYDVGGYNYLNGEWYNCFAHSMTDNGTIYNVRFGKDATSNCIWIGETGTTWDYPQVYVTDVQVGYSNYDENWLTNWSITPVTTFDNVVVNYTTSIILNSKTQSYAYNLNQNLRTTDNVNFQLVGSNSNYASFLMIPTTSGAVGYRWTLNNDNTLLLQSSTNLFATASTIISFNNNGNIYTNNSSTLYSKDTSGNTVPVLYGRWSDNATYLDGGIGGTYLRVNNGNLTAIRIYNNGNVGIGGIATEKLQVDVPNVANTKLIKFSTNNNTYNYGDISVQSGELRYSSTYAIGIAPNNTVSGFFDINGNFGIGTSSPSYRLQVNNTLGGNVGIDTNGSLSFNYQSEIVPRIYIDRDGVGSGLPGIVFKSGSSGTQGANGSAIGSPSSQILALYTSNGTSLTERIRIFGNGNVSIGTTTDNGYKLYVNGNYASSGSILTQGAITLAANGSSNDPYGAISVTNPTTSSYSYYGLTRQSSIGLGMGITTSNQFFIGQTSAGGVNSVLTTSFMLLTASLAQFNGNINTLSNSYSINGNPALATFGNYTILYDVTSLRPGIYVGNINDPGNYYDNDIHNFRDRSSNMFVTISSRGLRLLNYTTTQINALTSVTGGNLVFDSTTNAVKVYTASGWLSVKTIGIGDVLNVKMLSNSEVTITTSTATSTSFSTFATVSYTPTSTSSYVIVECYYNYTIGGGGTDSYIANIEVDGAEISSTKSTFEGLDRTNKLTPIVGRYTNSTITAKNINVRMKRNSSDDNVTILNDNTFWLKITEITR